MICEDCGADRLVRELKVLGTTHQIAMACKCSSRGISIAERSTIENLRARVDALSSVPRRFLDARIDAVPAKPRAFLERVLLELPDLRPRWSEQNLPEGLGRLHVSGKGVAFYGPVGPGKSYALGAFLAAARERLIPGTFLPGAMLQHRLEEADRFSARESRAALLLRLAATPLLAIDDFDKLIASSPAIAVAVYELIDARSRDLRPLMISTNVRPEELATAIFGRNEGHGAAVADRLLDMVRWCEFRGASRRGTASAPTAATT